MCQADIQDLRTGFLRQQWIPGIGKWAVCGSGIFVIAESEKEASHLYWEIKQEIQRKRYGYQYGYISENRDPF